MRDLEGKKADYVLTKLEKAFHSLEEFPDRGTIPEDLIADGRRNMETLLQNRILAA